MLFFVLFLFIASNTLLLGSFNPKKKDDLSFLTDISHVYNKKKIKTKTKKSSSRSSSSSKDDSSDEKHDNTQTKIIYNDKELQKILEKEKTINQEMEKIESKKHFIPRLKAELQNDLVYKKNLQTNTQSRDELDVLNQYENTPESKFTQKIDKSEKKSDEPSSDDSSDEQPTPTSWKKKFAVGVGISALLLCCYGAYKYFPWKKIIKSKIPYLSSLLSFSKKSFLVDTTPSDQDTNLIVDQGSSSVANSLNNGDGDIEITIEKPNIIPKSQKSKQKIFGASQYASRSMQLVGSSFSATFLLALAAYLITNNNNENLKKIEKNRYETCRTLLRYTVAAVAFSVSVVLFLKITQNT